MKKVFAYIIVVVISSFSDALFGMDERNPLGSSTTNRTYIDDIKDNLPLLAQPDAEEFCEQMKHSFTSLFPNNNNSHVRAWGEFFKSVIIHREMGVKSLPYVSSVDINTVIDTITVPATKPTKQSKEMSILFHSISEKNRSNLQLQHLDVFLRKLNSTPFKKLKEKNSYALCVDGFLDLLQGLQGIEKNYKEKKKHGEYKLFLAAYKLNGLALKVLKDMNMNTGNLKKKHELLLKPISHNFLEDCIKEKYFLESEESSFINPLDENQYNQYQMIRNKMYEQLINVYYKALSDEKKTLYVDINEYLRDKLLERRNSVSLYSTISWKLSVIVPFILDLSPPIMNIIAYRMITSTDNNEIARDIIIAGAVIAFIMPFFILAQGVHQWWISSGKVLYNEDQIQMTALYYTMFYGAPYKTAGNIVQPFIDYLDKQDNRNKTLTQHAVDFKKGEKK